MEVCKIKIQEEIEIRELIQKLYDNGHGDLVDAFLLNEKEVYTKKSRLNKCGACRVLGWKTKKLEEKLRECRELLTDSNNNDIFEE